MNSLKPSKLALSGLSLPDLIKVLEPTQLPLYKLKQIHAWIYAKFGTSFSQMSDLSLAERQLLDNNYVLSVLNTKDCQISKDGTKKYLFSLNNDDKYIESVLMTFQKREDLSVCVSSQVGCAVGCKFCATSFVNFKRNLTSQEIVDQVMSIQRDNQVRIGNIVYMGQGEPLLNTEEVIKSIYVFANSVGIGKRHITVSTSGIIPGINRLAKENLPITLALSLHACDDDLRNSIMPGVKTYSIKNTFQALTEYLQTTNRRVTIEYVLLAGVNDSSEQAHKLAKLVSKINCHINLIPYNPINELSESISYKRPSIEVQEAFKAIVETSGRKVTSRLERGKDISAACGQLHNKHLNQRVPS